MLDSQIFDFSVLDMSDPRFFIPWRLSGLLSGYLPTDTRPQARAKLGKNANKGFDSASQHFFCAAGNFLTNCVQRRAECEQTLSFFNEC
jgi:hypothetical protein